MPQKHDDGIQPFSFMSYIIILYFFRWGFLELLGFISFFGILLTQCQSYKMDLTICMITVFSISLLCYIVSDLDSPFAGFFRVDVSVILDVIARTEVMYKSCGQGHDDFCGYIKFNPKDSKTY